MKHSFSVEFQNKLINMFDDDGDDMNFCNIYNLKGKEKGVIFLIEHE